MKLPRVYAIVDEEVSSRAGIDPVALAEAYLQGGVRWLQLRAKHASSATLFGWAQAIAARARDVGAHLVVNDRVDVACLVSAGVHIGQRDLPTAAVRALAGEDALIGVSTHNSEQIEAALAEPLSYLAVGPVFFTATKATGYEAVGLDLVREAARRVGGRVPVVAIGGITLDNAHQVLAAGADAVAVISDLLVGDPRTRARTWTRQTSGFGLQASGGEDGSRLAGRDV